MSAQEEAREAMAQSRQHKEQVEKSMLSRTQAEVETATNDGVEEEAREALSSKRRRDEHLQEAMLHRAAEETGLSGDATQNS
ncbi:MAG: hypothetical protein QNJ46_21495 [Leptolyngbyaceae cyanobacterium MO_188.B28]|nr:hypothetical protein [Leptolyngbyaceae cyanobacterium MO_188.B28]